MQPLSEDRILQLLGDGIEEFHDEENLQAELWILAELSEENNNSEGPCDEMEPELVTSVTTTNRRRSRQPNSRSSTPNYVHSSSSSSFTLHSFTTSRVVLCLVR